jgi:hypothetical protein
MSICDCGDWYDDEGYKTSCRRCFASKKREEESDLKNKLVTLESQVKTLSIKNAELVNSLKLEKMLNSKPSKPALDSDMLKRLVHLCHPDKHSNSEMSNIAFKYLRAL